MITILVITLFCWTVTRRVLREDCALLAAPLTFSLASLLLLSLANAKVNLGLACIVLALGTASMLAKLPSARLVGPNLSKTTRAVLLLIGGVVFGYTNLSQNLFLDDDFWIHFPIQGLLERDGLPLFHPFFAEIEMNGHYGRDLLVGMVSRLTGISLLHSLFWQTTLIQLASLSTIVGLVWRCTRSELSAVLAATFIFFGINVGGRAGLLDTFQNNNALAYLMVLSILHLVYLVHQNAAPPRVAIAGLALGAYALIYETNFGLLGLVLCVICMATRRKEFALVGVIALTVAAVQGGPLTSLVKERMSPTQREWTPGELNQHQIVKITFPKKELFCLQLAYGNYQRLSCAYHILPDLGPITSITPGTPYRPIWSWDVLQIHWLSTLLAPFSLAVLLRERRASKPSGGLVGLGLWLFALFAFLTPSLVHFGPIYEFEYFRWQFAAGFGFAGALGIASGRLLERVRPRVRLPVLALLLVLNIAPILSIFFPRLLEGAFQRGRVRDLWWPRPEATWILRQTPQLGGFGYFDLMVAYELRRRSQPGQGVLLLNAPYDSPWDIHYESTLIGLSGLRSVGHSLPWPNEPVGTPPFHRSTPYQVFSRYPSEELLDQLKANWILEKPALEPNFPLRSWLDAHCNLVWQDGDYRLYQRTEGDTEREQYTVADTLSQRRPPTLTGLPHTLKTAELFDLVAEGDGHTWAWAFVERSQSPQTIDQHEVVSWRSGPSAGVAPPLPGTYELLVFEIEGLRLYPTALRFPITVTERK